MTQRQPVVLQVPELVPGALSGPVAVRARVTSRRAEPWSVLVRVVGTLSGLEPAQIVELPTTEPVDVDLPLRLPAGMSPGRHRLLVQVVDRTTGEVLAERETNLVVEATRAITVGVSPRAVNGRRIGRFRVNVRNHDDVPHVISLRAEPDEPGLKVWLKQPEVRLRPGDHVRVKGRFATRPFAVGPLREKWFTVVGESTGASVYGRGSIRQMPMIHRGIMRILGLVGIIGVWLAGTLVVMRAIEPVTDEAAVGAEAGAGSDSGSGGSSGGGGGEDAPPVSVSGTVTAVPDGAGVTVLWRPVVLADTTAADGKASPAAETAATDVASQRTETDADGAFEVAGLDGDGLYEFTFAKAGNSSQTVLVQPAGESKVLEIALTAGDGVIAGTILGQNGLPLGGATLTLTDGAITYGASTPTSGDGVGTFRFEYLSTPGTYVLQAEAPGRGLASTTIDLAEGASATGVTLTLSRDIGAIIGRVTSVGFEAASTRSTTPVPGVLVTATDGTITRTTSTQSEGELAGSFALVGLPLGRTYTVTYTGDGWSPRTELVELTVDTAPLAVSLVPSTGRLTGTVSVPPDTVSPASVAVTLLNSDVTYKSTDAISADGELLMSNIEPGSYVAVFEALGLEDQVREVEISAGLTSSLDIDMTAPPGGAEFGTITVKTTNLSTNEALDTTVVMRFRTSGCGTVSGATTSATTSACSWSTSAGGLTVSQVPAGSYVLELTRTGFRSELRTITVSPGKTTAVEAALAPLGSLTGIITDAEGGFLQGAEVRLYFAEDTARTSPVSSVRSNERGEYALSQLLDSKAYTMIVELAGFTTIERPLEAAVATTINIDLTMRSKAQVIGEVRQLEIETGQFTAVRAQDFTVWLKRTDGTWVDTAMTGLVRGLGSYRLAIEPNVVAADASVSAGTTIPYEVCVVLNPVSVAGTPCEGGFVRRFDGLTLATGDLALRSAYFTPNPATISGTVSVGLSDASLSAETFIEARRINDIDKSVLETVQVAVQPDRTFTFNGLTPTTANVSVPGSTYWVLRVDTAEGSYSTPSNEPIALIPGGTVNVPITLVKSPGSVEIVVVDDSGQGIEGMPVWLVASGSATPGAIDCDTAASTASQQCTDASGIVDFGAVSAGVYTAFVGNPNEGSDYLRQSVRVTVTGGDRVNRTVRMSIQLGTVQATVIDDVTGSPVVGATVRAGSRTVVTDQDGVAELIDLRAGTQTVTVAAMPVLGYPEATAIVSVPSGRAIAPVVVRMAKNIGDLVVNVIGPDGAPYTRGVITVTKVGGQAATETGCTPPSDGRYCYAGLPTGATSVLVTPDASDGFANATVVANVNRFGAAIVTVVMQRSNGGMALTLTDAESGAVLDGAVVAATAQSVGTGAVSALSFGGGRWAVGGLDPGGYDVAISAVNGSGYPTRVVRVDVSSGSVANLALSLTRQVGNLNLVAVDDSTGLPISLAGATATISALVGGSVTTSACSAMVCTFAGLAPGIVAVSTSGPSGYAPSSGRALVLPGGRDSLAIVRLVPTNGMVVVKVQTADGQSVVNAALSVDGQPVTATTVSASTGIRYQISGVEPGTRTITVASSGYETASAVVQVDRTGSAAVTIVLRQITGRLDVLVGDAITGRPVTATAVAARPDDPTSTVAGVAIASVDGGLRWVNLAAGAWTVTLSASGYESRSVPVAIVAGETTTLNLALQPASTALSVRAVDAATGQSISFANTLVTASNGPTPRTSTCTGSTCEISGVAVGTVTLTVNAIGDYAASTITTNVAASTSPTVVTVPMARLGEFVVSLVDAGNAPVVDANVTVTDSAGVRIPSTCSVPIAGTYCFRDVVPGTVIINAAPTPTTTPTGLTAHTVVAVADARGAGSARLTLARSSGTVWFTLFDGASGVPLGGRSVELTSGSSTIALSDTGSGRYVTDAAPGTWTLSVAASYPYLAYSTTVAVVAGQVTQLSAALLAVEASIAGTVSTAAGAVAGAVITATPASGASVVAVTDANGQYRISGLVSGMWTVSVSATGYGTGAAQTVQVGGTSAATADFSLTAEVATLRVNVLTSFGSPIDAIAVTVSAGADLSGTLSSAGAATVAAIPAGIYTVSFADSVVPARYRAQSLQVELERGRTTTITVYMTGAGALVEARVVGTPAAHLLASPLNGVHVGLRTRGTSPEVIEVATSSTGVVRFESVEPGAYDVVLLLEPTTSSAVIAAGSAVIISGVTYVVPTLGSVTVGENGLDVFAGEVRLVAQTVSVNISVTDSATSSPIDGATVTLVGGNLPGDRSLSTAAGTSSFVDVPPGTYTVRVAAAGYVTSESQLSVRDASVNAGTETASVALVAGAGGLVVDVRDETGAAITDAAVDVTVGAVAHSKSSAPYEFSGLAPGRAEIAVSATGFVTGFQSITIQSGVTASATVVLRRSPATSGDLVVYVRHADTDALIAGASVTLTGMSPVTATGGSATVSSLAAGPVTFEVSASGFITRSSSATVVAGSVATVTVELRPVPTPEPTTGSLVVYVRDAEDDSLIDGATVTVNDVSTSSTAGGSVVVQPLAAGAVTVSASGTGRVTRTITTTIVAGSTTQVTVHLDREAPTTGDLEVYVRDAATDGLVASATVKVGAQTKSTSASGIAQFPALAAGAVTIEVSADGYVTRTITATVVAGSTRSFTVHLDTVPPTTTTSTTTTTIATSTTGA